MELELGLKITHNRDDITSHSNLRIAKDHSGPLFLSRETDSMFFLIAYLKGFKRENIEIDINNGGNRIAVSGKRAVQEMVLSGWIMRKKDVELRAFRKVFQIPDGIILDRIKAKFNDQESSLTIVMPKLVKGMCGFEIQEVKEEEELGRGQQPAVNRTGDDKIIEGDKMEAQKKKMEEVVHNEIDRREPEMPGTMANVISMEEKLEAVTAEVVPDNNKEMISQEKPEEPRTQNKGNPDEGEVEKMKYVAEVEPEPERSQDMKLQEKPEIEGGVESEKVHPEKAKPPTTKLNHRETVAVKPEEVKPEKKINQAQKKTTASKDIPEVKEQQKKHGRAEVPKLAQESKEEEPGRKLEETRNSEPDKEQNKHESEKPTEKAATNEYNEQEESHNSTPDGIKEEKDEEKLSEEDELLEIEKQKQLAEQATKRKNSVRKGSKLCPPLVVTGSAILVTIIVLVINLIRTKRK